MEWAKACSPLFSKIQEFKKQFPGYKAIIDFCTNAFPQSKKINDTVVAIDPLNFITVKSTVNVNGSEKKVVLIFDDLERSRLDTIDVLGCINEYCENQGINTIIVANEDILRSNNNSSKCPVLLLWQGSRHGAVTVRKPVALGIPAGKARGCHAAELPSLSLEHFLSALLFLALFLGQHEADHIFNGGEKALRLVFQNGKNVENV